jgi:ABC-type sugar transport system ATPase subunit
VGTKSEIYKLMGSLLKEGISIIFFSTELTELTRLCSRVLVFYEGKVAAELVGGNITEENIIVSSLGANAGGKQNEK